MCEDHSVITTYFWLYYIYKIAFMLFIKLSSSDKTKNQEKKTYVLLYCISIVYVGINATSRKILFYIYEQFLVFQSRTNFVQMLLVALMVTVIQLNNC